MRLQQIRNGTPQAYLIKPYALREREGEEKRSPFSQMTWSNLLHPAMPISG